MEQDLPAASAYAPKAIDEHVISDLLSIGHGSLLIRVLRLFKSHVPVVLGQIEAAMMAQDWVKTDEAAHALKSVLASIGAMAAFKICNELEQMAKQANSAALVETLPQLKATIEQAMAEVNLLESQYDEKEAAIPFQRRSAV